MRIELDDGPQAGEPRVLLDGRDVSAAIRAPEVAAEASRVAAEPSVRAALLEKQRGLSGRGDWVAEGRDIGTVVAPHAELKVFLDRRPARAGPPACAASWERTRKPSSASCPPATA